jgi:hypothetical protein
LILAARKLPINASCAAIGLWGLTNSTALTLLPPCGLSWSATAPAWAQGWGW